MAALVKARPTSNDGTMYPIFERLMQDIQQLPESFEDLSALPAIQEMMMHHDMELKVLVAGQTGTGKSTLVNALSASNEAKVSGISRDGCTKEVRCYKRVVNSVAIEIYDTPGLQDVSQLQDVEYIKMMERACKGYDLSLFCVSMRETRLPKSGSNVATMTALSKAFSNEQYWNSTVIVLTFANVVPQAHVAQDAEQQNRIFKHEFEAWKKVIKEALIEDVGVPPSIADKVPIIPAGHYHKPCLFSQQNWLSNLWLQCFCRLKESAAASMLVANASRITSPDRAIVSTGGPEEQPIPISKKGFIAIIAEFLQTLYHRVRTALFECQ